MLIVEDDEEWRDILRSYLSTLQAEKVEIEETAEPDSARRLLKERPYDLVTIDPTLFGGGDEEGLELLEETRKRGPNINTAALIITGNRDPDLRRAFRDLGAYEVFVKSELNKDVFVNKAEEAVLENLPRKVYEKIGAHIERKEASHYFTVSFALDGFLSCRLRGPSIAGGHTAPRAMPWKDGGRLANSADELQEAIRNRSRGWRSHAEELGRSVYEGLLLDQKIREDLQYARNLQPATWLRFSSTKPGLRAPFELLRAGSDYLALEHILSRQLEDEDLPPSTKADSFPRFLKSLFKNSEPLKILLVGSPGAPFLPAVAEEINEVETLLREGLEEQSGIQTEITKLCHPHVSVDEVRNALRDGYHMLHYAGHGSGDVQLPENSGLRLMKDGKVETLTAQQLKLMVQKTDLRLVFLSCCLGAWTADDRKRGDFHGMFDALVKGGVPTAIGYRWPVSDRGALEVARLFYDELARTFCPGEALLAARVGVADRLGRDDPTWASLMMLSQTA